MTLDECRNEHLQPYRKPCFWDTLDYEFLVANSVGHIVVLDLAGALAGPESQELYARIRQLVERGERMIVVNLWAVEKVDSEGLGELVRCLVTLKRIGGMMPLVNPPQHFRQLVASMKFL